MTAESIVDRFIRYAERLYYRRWDTWEMLTLGGAVLLVVILLIRSCQKKAKMEHHILTDRTPDKRLQKFREP